MMRNCNVCAMLKESLSQKELANCDRGVLPKLDPTALVPAEMKLCSWLRVVRVRNPRDLSYDVLHGGAGPAGRCQVRGCARGECLARLRVGSAAVCADHLWECRVGVKAATLSAGVCAGCLMPVADMEMWLLSYGHWVCSACAETEARTIPSPLEDPVSSCLSCPRALHRPYKFGLDGQVRCGSCSSILPSGGALPEDMATRLVLVWLGVCDSRLPARFMAAGHLFLRSIGRLLAGASVSALIDEICLRQLLFSQWHSAKSLRHLR